MSDRRYKLLQQGLPGSSSFTRGDLIEGSHVSWDASTNKWRISNSLVDSVDGIIVRDNSGDIAAVVFQTSDESQAAVIFTNSTGDGLTIRSNVHGGLVRIDGEDAGGSVRNLVVGDPDGNVTLYDDGTEELSTQTHNAAGSTSGARVKDHSNTWRDVGFNVMPVVEQDSSASFDEDYVGKIIHRDTTSTITYTLPSGTSAGDPPIGATIMIANENTGTLNITPEGTLRWFQGTGSAAPTTGSRTLNRDGVCWVYKYSSSEWWIWGYGIA